jgi:L-asparaginase/Glu-tRNA(Gln) amidotransferase subunit D
VKPRIAHMAGSNATITNSAALVTSNKARAQRGLELLRDESGQPIRFDTLRPQRLAKAVKVYVEQFSAHPLERDAAELYGPPDGYLDGAGNFHRSRTSDKDVAVYEVTLDPKDGVYPLPYMAVQADGKPWEDDGVAPMASAERSRQPFYPDGSRLFEEIDRLGYDGHGKSSLISSRADIDFYRVTPPGGYKKDNEVMGRDFFPYRPYHLAMSPPRGALATITNGVQKIMASGKYAGAIWTQGSPRIEETLYWLNLLIDTTLPICGNSSQRVHGMVGNEGDKNLVDSTEFIASRVWADDAGRNRLGVVLVQEQRIFAARDVQKGDARPGGYVVTGGHGGIVGAVGHEGPPTLTYIPARKHTYQSEVNLSRLPAEVKNERGELLADAIPKVSIIKEANYYAEGDDPEDDADIVALMERNTRRYPRAGFVLEGHSPYGTAASAARTRLLRTAVERGMPVAIVGRGNHEGFSAPQGPFIGGRNLTSTKARLLLMACLLRFGAGPDLARKLPQYQAIFDSH